jgi:AAA family ATP:ADP antiporter
VVTNLLISKTESNKKLEVIHSLNLLERSGYMDLFKLLLKHLQNPVQEIREYILTRIIANNMTSALPIITQQLNKNNNDQLQLKLIKAFYFLDKEIGADDKAAIQSLPPEHKKAAMEGLLLRKEQDIEKLVVDNLVVMASGTLADKLLALDVVMDCDCENYTEVLDILLSDHEPKVYKKAIEASGKVKNLQLLQKVLDVAVAKKAFSSLKRSIVHYGDSMFLEDNWQNRKLVGELPEIFIKSAGNIKGDHSTRFLEEMLKQDEDKADAIIEALWLKKSKVSTETIQLIEHWANKKTEHGKYKMDCYFEVLHHENLTLLQNALIMEIRKDVQLLLKSFSLLYDREKVDRVIELLAIANNSKISNAIEILEIIIPPRYFRHLNNFVELIDDVQHKKEVLTKTQGLHPNTIIEEVIKNNKANFSEWTRSVACFMIPKIKKNEMSIKMLHVKKPSDGYLFTETKHYILSMLN